jgi:5-methylthioribose kinase
MQQVDADNVVDYLHSAGHLDPSIPADVEWLAWGVSNVVLRVHPMTGDDVVLKQSRSQLRTDVAWFSRLDRIWREMDLMRELAALLPHGAVPRILFEDRDNYLFGMQAVDTGHVVWKEDLLNGKFDPAVAVALAGYLSTIHRKTAGNDQLAEQWSDREVFVQLRVDPFYRRIAEVHAEIEPHITRMVDEMFETAACVVHADFSPKNILIAPSRRAADGWQLTLVDYETGHYGDPAFDLGFFLSHLALKAVYHGHHGRDVLALARTFWNTYVDGLGLQARSGAFAEPELERRAVAHLAGCMLARIDGTSPVDYLSAPADQDLVRQYCHDLFLNSIESLEESMARLEGKISERRDTGDRREHRRK